MVLFLWCILWWFWNTSDVHHWTVIRSLKHLVLFFFPPPKTAVHQCLKESTHTTFNFIFFPQIHWHFLRSSLVVFAYLIMFGFCMHRLKAAMLKESRVKEKRVWFHQDGTSGQCNLSSQKPHTHSYTHKPYCNQTPQFSRIITLLELEDVTMDLSPLSVSRDSRSCGVCACARVPAVRVNFQPRFRSCFCQCVTQYHADRMQETLGGSERFQRSTSKSKTNTTNSIKYIISIKCIITSVYYATRSLCSSPVSGLLMFGHVHSNSQIIVLPYFQSWLHTELG